MSARIGLQDTLDLAIAGLPVEQRAEIAVSIANLDAGEASYRGDIPIYPASVAKLFFLAAAHAWMEEGRIAETMELERALRDMIVDSSNDAAHYVVDVLTGTTSGPELPPAEMAQWIAQRMAIQRYFESTGYGGVHLSQKTWTEGPYGRESEFRRMGYRNQLTTNTTMRLLRSIIRGECVSATRSEKMLALLERNPCPARPSLNDQGCAFIGSALPAGSALWSKAGWTSQTRHDAAYVKLPSGKKVVLVIFTVGCAEDHTLLPALARRLLP
jgi:hypothetical protein